MINVTNVWTLDEVFRHKLSEPLMKMIKLIKMMERECVNVRRCCAWVGRITFPELQKTLICPVEAEDRLQYMERTHRPVGTEDRSF